MEEGHSHVSHSLWRYLVVWLVYMQKSSPSLLPLFFLLPFSKSRQVHCDALPFFKFSLNCCVVESFSWILSMRCSERGEKNETREEIGRGRILVVKCKRRFLCQSLLVLSRRVECWTRPILGTLHLRRLFIFHVVKVKPQKTRSCELFPQIENYQNFDLFWKYHLLAL